MNVAAIEREVSIRSCGECGGDSVHFRACADCAFTVSRCDRCGGNKGASREMFLHRQREHGLQLQIGGCETPPDPALEAKRPRVVEDCRRCEVCEAFAASDDATHAFVLERLPCGHLVADSANHTRPCPWVGCRHHALIEIAHAKPRRDKRGRKRDARPTSIRMNRAPRPGQMGRRPGLHAQAATEEVQAWIEAAVEHLDSMEYTCTLDVAEDHPDGYPLGDTADLLGVTPAAIKQEVACASKLRRGLAEYKDHAPDDHAGLLARAQER